MKKKWIFLIAPPAVVLFVAVCGEVVMHLWNWLLPSLFGWHSVTLWQALGLLVLCRILFGGFGGHNHGRRGPRRFSAERWESMTPEERNKLRERLRHSRCGDFGTPDRDMPPDDVKSPA